jgi:stage II sporulation protein D
VDDSFCEANAFNGHGVGLSGCGATGMAQNGFNYQEILSHYYIDTDLVKQY